MFGSGVRADGNKAAAQRRCLMKRFYVEKRSTVSLCGFFYLLNRRDFLGEREKTAAELTKTKRRTILHF